MPTHDTPTADGDDVHASTTHGATAGRGTRSRAGTLATIAGGATLLWAATTIRKNAVKGTLLALAGAALIGVGRQQRRGASEEHPAETGITVSLDVDGEDDADGENEKQVSDDAHVQASGDLGAGRNADESQSGSQSGDDSNPRGIPEDEALEQDDDDGSEFDFVDGKEPATHDEPHLDEDEDQDPRLEGDEDEQTQIDVSDSAMADEASEAAGPQPEQAFPSMEGTDPEPQSAQAPPRSDDAVEDGAETADDGDDVAEGTASETQETKETEDLRADSEESEEGTADVSEGTEETTNGTEDAGGQRTDGEDSEDAT